MGNLYQLRIYGVRLWLLKYKINSESLLALFLKIMKEIHSPQRFTGKSSCSQYFLSQPPTLFSHEPPQWSPQPSSIPSPIFLLLCRSIKPLFPEKNFKPTSPTLSQMKREAFSKGAGSYEIFFGRVERGRVGIFLPFPWYSDKWFWYLSPFESYHSNARQPRHKAFSFLEMFYYLADFYYKVHFFPYTGPRKRCYCVGVDNFHLSQQRAQSVTSRAGDPSTESPSQDSWPHWLQFQQGLAQRKRLTLGVPVTLPMGTILRRRKLLSLTKRPWWQWLWLLLSIFTRSPEGGPPADQHVHRVWHDPSLHPVDLGAPQGSESHLAGLIPQGSSGHQAFWKNSWPTPTPPTSSPNTAP